MCLAAMQALGIPYLGDPLSRHGLLPTEAYISLGWGQQAINKQINE